MLQFGTEDKSPVTYIMNQTGHGQSHSLLEMEQLLDKVKQYLYEFLNDQTIDENWKKDQIVIVLRLVNLVNRVILSKEETIRLRSNHTIDT